MKSNSGQGKATNNNNDPTLKERAGQGGALENGGGDFTEGAPFPEGGAPGETTSPSDRARGETASTDKVAPTDPDRG